MAIQYLGTTISGLSSDTKPSTGAETISANEKGVIFIETDTNKIYQWDTDSWNELITSDNTSVGILNSGSIDTGFGDIDIGTNDITTTGTISAGTLTVTGSTTTVDSSVTTIVDPIIHLQSISGGGDLTGDTNKDVGLALQYYSGSAKTAFLGFDDTDAKLMFIPDATISSEVVSGSVGTIKANLDGEAPAGNLSGGTLNSTVLASSLTSVGTITTGEWQGTAIASAHLDADTAHLSGTQTFSGAKTFSNGVTVTQTASPHYDFSGNWTVANHPNPYIANVSGVGMTLGTYKFNIITNAASSTGVDFSIDHNGLVSIPGTLTTTGLTTQLYQELLLLLVY